MKAIAHSCPNGNCPKVMDPEDGGDDVLVQGFTTDHKAPKGETVVRAPRQMIIEAGQRLEWRPRLDSSSLVAGPVDDFGALFDRLTDSAFRLETLQAYNVAEDTESIASWRAGRARPEFSVRTSQWAARLATSILAGRSWRRVRVVDLPLSEYVRWEMAAYIESAVLGEEIRILVRSGEFAGLTNDFWLFDATTSRPYAVDQLYDATGRPGTHQLVTDRDLIAARYAALAERAWRAAVPLNQWLARPDTDLRRSA